MLIELKDLMNEYRLEAVLLSCGCDIEKSCENSIFVLEGLDGSGKSSIVNKIKEKHNKEFKYTREPGGITALANDVRNLIMTYEMDTRTEALAFALSRSANMNAVLETLKTKNMIIDRYDLSSIAYQSINGISLDEITNLQNFYKTDVVKSNTFYLFIDIEPEEAYERLINRVDEFNRLDYIDKSKDDFIENYKTRRDNYLEAIAKTKLPCFIIDGHGTIEEIYVKCNNIINRIIELKKGGRV